MARLRHGRYGVRIPAKRSVSFVHDIQNGSKAHSLSYSMVAGSGKAAGVRVDLSLHLVLRLKTIGAIPLLPLYAYMSLMKPILCFYVALNYEMTVSNDWDKIC